MRDIIRAIFGFLTNRLFLLSLVVTALFYILASALFRLQIIEGEELSRAFELSVIREVESEGQRGNIYDRFGVPLAVNVMAYDVYLNDSYEVNDKNQMIHTLVSIIDSHGDEVIWNMPMVIENGQVVFSGSGLSNKTVQEERI